MGLAHIDNITHYLDMLQQRPEEVTALYKDLLISVTAFFRDPDAYRVLEQDLIPALIARQTGESPIRIWVPGCATGEEAYSIAMLLLEGMEAANLKRNIQIFASDIDQDAIDVARTGIYPASIVGDILPERLTRFLSIVDDSHYQINKQLRESIVFSHQNLISDAPFSRLDLISCRNLLIYLEPEMQQKVIALFHFALSADGYLLLGPSETIGRTTDLFETVSKKWRVFRRIGPSRRDLIGIPLIKIDERGSVSQQPTPAVHRKGLKELTEKLILNEYAPAAALINRKFEVLYVTGPLVNYLEFPLGELTKDLLAMARAGLRTKLRFTCNNAFRDGKTVVEEARVKRNGHYVHCSVTVRPLSGSKETEGLMLVVFKDRGPWQSIDESNAFVSTDPNHSDSGSAASKSETHQDEDSQLVQQLEIELKSMSEELHSTIEEMESSTEELKTSNEEIMSVNEELQSANEELETSKEELQSLNEELSTVNSQLQDKVAELDKASDDLMNLMSSTEIATIFLDKQLDIKRFTPPTKSLWNLRFTDIGRPLREIASAFLDGQMLSECEQVLESLVPIEREVQTDESHYYLRRILPYRSTDNLVGGVVITFVDLTQRKQAETVQREADVRSVAALQESTERMRAILNTAADAIITIDQQGKIDSINLATEKLFGYTRDELMGKNVSLLIPSIYGNQHGGTVVDDGDNRQAQFIGRTQDAVAIRKNGSSFPVDFVFSKVDHLDLFTGILRDISERKELQTHILEIASEEQRRIGQELHDGTQQELTGLTLFAGALCELLDTVAQTKRPGEEDWMLNENDLGKLKHTANRLLQGLKETNLHVRNLSHGIMPVQIDAEGLRSALAELAAVTNEQQKIHCHFECTGSGSVSNNSIATQLYRIAQESLNNALQHGLANEILISLSQPDRQIILEVCDNGVGIGPHFKDGLGKMGSGMGLRIMEYRAGIIGGALQVDGSSGSGTTVRCIVPTSQIQQSCHRI